MVVIIIKVSLSLYCLHGGYYYQGIPFTVLSTWWLLLSRYPFHCIVYMVVIIKVSLSLYCLHGCYYQDMPFTVLSTWLLLSRYAFHCIVYMVVIITWVGVKNFGFTEKQKNIEQASRGYPGPGGV